MKRDNKGHFSKVLALAGMVCLPMMSIAQTDGSNPSVGYFSNPLFYALLLIIGVLAIIIVALGNALKNVISSDMFREKVKSEKEENSKNAAKITGLAIFFTLMNLSAFSQGSLSQVAQSDLIGGLDQFTFYVMLIIISMELLVLGILFNTFKTILGVNRSAIKANAEIKPKTKTILDKLNDTVDLDQEESIMLDHDYDGIKELDNNLPPWWKYGFYLTILIAFIYLINYHIAKTSPLQAEEYSRSITKAEAEIAEYMKTSANNVDESTVKMLTSDADLNAGKDIFIATCSACHGKFGEGTVGPNLTDDYWIHSGSVKDIFKTIKYGWPDKGMKSWKEDFSPVQIAQVTSYIRTLKGTNPPKPKDKQGELYLEQVAPADSASVVTDSTKVLHAEATPKKN